MPADVLYLILAGVAGLITGLIAGLALTYPRMTRLREALRLKQAELDKRADVDAEREQTMALATERLGSAFSQLASQQFQAHSETFLKLARESLGTHHERARGDLTQRQEAIDGMIRPIREALTRTEAQLQELDKARRETHGSIKAQLEAMAAGQQALSIETRNLVTALRRPEVRGQWGELTLRRLVELSGMVEHCDFATQTHHATETGAIRPDMLIKLPEGRQLVVDVKTPLDAYLEGAQAETEADRRAAFARHATVMADRIRELASKAYWSQFEDSPDFVILFIPGDQFLSAALSHRPGLLDEALRQNIILTTPSSFVALLKAVAYGWQQVALADNAAEIRRLGVQLYERLTTFTAHLAQVGKELGDSVKAYNRSVGSLERMVLPSARRFTELGVQPRQRLDETKPVEDTPREPALGAPDPLATLVDGDDGSSSADDGELRAEQAAASSADDGELRAEQAAADGGRRCDADQEVDDGQPGDENEAANNGGPARECGAADDEEAGAEPEAGAESEVGAESDMGMESEPAADAVYVEASPDNRASHEGTRATRTTDMSEMTEPAAEETEDAEPMGTPQ